MRTPTILVILLAGFLLAAPLVLAEGGRGDEHRQAADDHRAESSDDDANETSDDNETDDDNETGDDESGESHGLSAESRAAWRENHTALIDSMIAQLQALRESWKENATAIREGCHTADLDHKNATHDERVSHAQCIRERYSEWRADHRADLKELREQLRALAESWSPRHESS